METREFLSILRWSSPPVLRGSDADFFGLDQQEFVSKESLSSSGSLSASRSRLVVHNYLGVSWLETLAMNTPTVCFSPAAITKFRDAARPFVDGLRRVGILHPSGREAAEFINSLDDGIEEWWQSVEVQSARRSFVERYANFSDDWLKEWLIEFDRLLQST
jgi:putative transferase (TIGR04331 family)